MYIKVKVIVDAKKEKFIKKSENYFIISVKESTKRNLANKRITEQFLIILIKMLH
ncbi:MAG: hypothetical protein V1651_01515 [Patescibacteria group bacterium]